VTVKDKFIKKMNFIMTGVTIFCLASSALKKQELQSEQG
jgi:hypothetical protein